MKRGIEMSYKRGNRYNQLILPPSIENYVGKDDPVRVYDTFVEALDFKELGIEIDENKVGNSAYDPKAMMKLLVYGYSYGWRSSRKLERATHHDLSFIWLMGGLKPDHKTIANYRKDNKKALKKVLTQCAKICIELNLIEGNTLFLDGSKIRGAASINKTYTEKSLKKKLGKISEKIDELLEVCNQTDEVENESLVKVSKELTGQKKLKTKVEETLKRLKESGKEKINLTDNECVNTKGRQGSHAGYNSQTVVDEKNGLILNNDVVKENNDINQFSKQIKQSNEILKENCKAACADAGYSYASNLKETLDEGIEVIVPNQKQAAHKPKEENPFDKKQFKYDREINCYICPEGKELKYAGYEKKKNMYSYVIKDKTDCMNCKNYGICTKGKTGRKVRRMKDEETKEMLEKHYEKEESQKIYKKRKEKVELPFGHIKRNLNGGAMLIKGLEGANAEMAINCTCFNIVRMITLLGGVRPLINKLMGFKSKE
jgi:transposase